MTLPRRFHPAWIVAPLLAAWGVGTAYAFWWFELRDLRPFAGTGANLPPAFDSARLQALAARVAWPGLTTVVHFWDPDCPCNRFNAVHLREIAARFHDRNVRFVAVARGGAGAAAGGEPFGPHVEPLADPGDPPDIPASPAALVVSGSGAIAYFGPYDTGATCGGNGRGFVELALENLLAGRPPVPGNGVAVGCYCAWESGSGAAPG